ncbi:MAG: hypothetical protein K1W28_01630 [Lachnospiraceae bacterium]
MNYQFGRNDDAAAKEVAGKTISIMEEMMDSMKIEGETEMQELRDRMVFLDYCKSAIEKAITKKKNNLLQEGQIRHERN